MSISVRVICVTKVECLYLSTNGKVIFSQDFCSVLFRYLEFKTP